MNDAGSMMRMPSHQRSVFGTRSRASGNESRVLLVEWIQTELPYPLEAAILVAQRERAKWFQNSHG